MKPNQLIALPTRNIIGIYFLFCLLGLSVFLFQWTTFQYVDTLLGFQVNSTPFLLATVLGFTSLGFLYFGRLSLHPSLNFIKLTGSIIIVIALWSLLFPFFISKSSALYDLFFSQSNNTGTLVDVLVVSFLLGFPNFLLGAPLPLLFQAHENTVRHPSVAPTLILGTFLVGSAIGYLIGGYYLASSIPLKQLVWFSSLLFFLIGATLLFYFSKQFTREFSGQKSSSSSPTGLEKESRNLLHSLFSSIKWLANKAPKEPLSRRMLTNAVVLGAFLTTFAISSTRLFSLSVGVNSHHNSLALSLFLLALGIGISAFKFLRKPNISTVFWVQISITATLLLVYLSVNIWPFYAHNVRVALREIPANITFFHYQIGIAYFFLISLPIGLSGALYPLLSTQLKSDSNSIGLHQGYVLFCIGIGSLLGCFFGGYVFLQFFNLDSLLKLTVGLVLLSAWITWPLYKPLTGIKLNNYASGSFLILIVSITLAPQTNKYNYLQPYRFITPIETISFNSNKRFSRYLAAPQDGTLTRQAVYRDGPSSTTTLTTVKVRNGKEIARRLLVDANIYGSTLMDSLVDELSGYLPMLFAKDQSRAAVIGFGTGQTVGSVLNSNKNTRVDIIEPSSELIKNHSFFDPYSENISSSERIEFKNYSPFRYFSFNKTRYNVIINHSHHLWNRKVENQFSSEFYALVESRLSNDGVFLQRIPIFDFNQELLVNLVRTLKTQFSHVRFFSIDAEMVVLATKKIITEEQIDRASSRFDELVSRSGPLTSLSLTQFETILAMESIPNSITSRMGEYGEVYSVLAPKLSKQVYDSFFLQEEIDTPLVRGLFNLKYIDMEDSLLVRKLGTSGLNSKLVARFEEAFCEVRNMQAHLCQETRAMQQVLSSLTSRDVASFYKVLPEAPSVSTNEEVSNIENILASMQEVHSPIFYIRAKKLKKRINSCTKNSPKGSTIKGKCLLHRYALASILNEKPKWMKIFRKKYLKWFKKLSKDNPEYSTFAKAAKQIKKK